MFSQAIVGHVSFKGKIMAVRRQCGIFKEFSTVRGCYRHSCRKPLYVLPLADTVAGGTHINLINTLEVCAMIYQLAIFRQSAAVSWDRKS